MCESMDVDTGEYNMLIDIHWRESWSKADPKTPMVGMVTLDPCAARQKILVAMKEARRAEHFLADLEKFFHSPAGTDTIEALFKDVRKVLKDQDSVWKDTLKSLLIVSSPSFKGAGATTSASANEK